MNARPTHPTDLRDTVSQTIAGAVARKAYSRIIALNAEPAEPLSSDEIHCWAAGFQQGYLLCRAERQKRKRL